MSTSPASPRSGPAISPRMVRRLGVAVVVVVLVLVVVLDTKVVSPEEFARLNPPAFNAATYARRTFPKLADRIAAEATDVTVLAPAVRRDLPAAGAKYGHDLGSGNYAFAIKATGTVAKVDADFVALRVADVPKGTEVRIPLGAAVNGTPVRDATGSITFGDFNDQTDFQSVANQFKLRVRQDVLDKLDKQGLKGKKLTVEGGWNTGGPPDSYIIQPTLIEVGS